jgi:DNA repair exonuclease SbcCD nuclease subunit
MSTIAILISDIHLCHTKPAARSPEPNWYDAMANILDQVKTLQQDFKCEVICAGDIFERWNSPPELVNFAIEHLPDDMYAIPGQHDLPYHNMDDIHKSAYWTLVEAGKITHLSREECLDFGIVYPFPFGVELETCCPVLEEKQRDRIPIRLAVAHKYIWIKGCNYPGAPQSGHITAIKDFASSYDVCLFGDNHQSFMTMMGKSVVWNNGVLIRRKSDESSYLLRVGLLQDNGSVKPFLLDDTEEKWLVDAEASEAASEHAESLDDFLDGLDRMVDSHFDFKEAVIRYIKQDEMDEHTKQVILEVLEGK